LALGRLRKIESPGAWKVAPWRRGVVALSVLQLLRVGLNEALTAKAYLIEVSEVEALPDFPLPQSIKMLDSGLKAGLARRGKHGGNAKRQAEADNAAQGSRRVASAVKAEVVIKLSVVWQSVAPPMSGKCSYSANCRPSWFDVRAPAWAPQGSSSEDVEGAVFAQAQALDKVECIDLSWRRQIPT
jgi:hypothetical protein